MDKIVNMESHVNISIQRISYLKRVKVNFNIYKKIKMNYLVEIKDQNLYKDQINSSIKIMSLFQISNINKKYQSLMH